MKGALEMQSIIISCVHPNIVIRISLKQKFSLAQHSWMLAGRGGLGDSSPSSLYRLEEHIWKVVTWLLRRHALQIGFWDTFTWLRGGTVMATGEEAVTQLSWSDERCCWCWFTQREREEEVSASCPSGMGMSQGRLKPDSLLWLLSPAPIINSFAIQLGSYLEDIQR